MPSPRDNGGFSGGQVVEAIIDANPELTANDVNVADASISITKNASGTGASYVNGEFTAIATGAGQYEGEVEVSGKFGRLNP